MFERYVERARRVLFFARYEASQLGGLSIEPAHLLLAILREGSTVVSATLDRAGLSVDSAHDAVASLCPPASTSSPPEIPFSADTQRALRYAAEEADRAGSGSGIDSDHLLLGVVRLGSPTASLLTDRGVTIDTIRALVAKERYDAPPLRGVISRFRPAAKASAASESETRFEVIVRHSTHADVRGSTKGTPDALELTNLGLPAILEAAFPGMPMSRIEIDPAFDGDMRFDVVVRGRHLSRDRRARLIREGLEVALDATASVETRDVDVYVITAGADARQRLGSDDQASGGFGAVSIGIGSASTSFSIPATDGEPPPHVGRSFGQFRKEMARGFIGGVSADGIPIEMFGHMIEEVLGRPVIDETGLTGGVTIQLPEVAPTTHEDFFARVRDRLGLIFTPARRGVTFVVLRKR